MTGTSVQGGVFKVSFEGTDAPTSEVASMTSLVIDQKLNLPAACTVVITPTDYNATAGQAMNFGTFELGSSMSASIGLQTPVQLFSGKIGALEPNLSRSRRQIEITGYDALFDLDFGNAIQTFANSTDSQIAAQVIEQAGFEPVVDTTEALYPYVLQNNVSAYRLLRSRAERLGFELLASGRQVYFRASQAGQEAVVSLEYGVTLTSFRARLRALKRGSSVTRQGWDPQAKQLITATVSSGPPTDRMGGEQTGYDASSGFASSAVTAPDASITDSQIATSLATGAYETGLDDFMEGVAECPGNAAITAGVNVSISNIGEGYDGLYYVVAARHSYDLYSGYKTRFDVRRTGI
jgi:phage protein D